MFTWGEEKNGIGLWMSSVKSIWLLVISPDQCLCVETLQLLFLELTRCH